MGGRDADEKRGTGMRMKKGGTNEKLDHVGMGTGMWLKKKHGDADEKLDRVGGPDERSAMCDKKKMGTFLQALKETGSAGEVTRVAEVSR